MSKTDTPTYWAGFCDGKLNMRDISNSVPETVRMPAIYKTRKQARERYQDVRMVKIVEVK